MTLKTKQENTKNYYFAFSNSDTNCLQTDDAENTKSRIHNSFNNIYMNFNITTVIKELMLKAC